MNTKEWTLNIQHHLDAIYNCVFVLVCFDSRNKPNTDNSYPLKSSCNSGDKHVKKQDLSCMPKLFDSYLIVICLKANHTEALANANLLMKYVEGI